MKEIKECDEKAHHIGNGNANESRPKSVRKYMAKLARYFDHMAPCNDILITNRFTQPSHFLIISKFSS